jgi:thiamine pyrophosphate-dependent acetolactate synthase large subunit-like protein
MPALRDLIVSRLKDAGVRALFGMPGGGGNLDLIEAAGQAGLPFVLCATETGGALAAMAQAEVTGRPGACLTTLGPGAASVANGVACAFLDRAPLLVFTDSHALAAAGAFEHQHFDHQAFFRPITKWSGRLSPECAQRTLDEAFAAVLDVPPGPVHVDCPEDSGLGQRLARAENSVRFSQRSRAPPPLALARRLRASLGPQALRGVPSSSPASARGSPATPPPCARFWSVAESRRW